jgi:chorismate mutase
MMFSIRGAITVDSDNEKDIVSSTDELLKKMIKINTVNIDDIVSIVFSCTTDLKSAYPAKAARQMGILNAGLLCLQEMQVNGSMNKCIRVLMHINSETSQNNAKHIFLREAVKLRPDLKQDFDEKY